MWYQGKTQEEEINNMDPLSKDKYCIGCMQIFIFLIILRKVIIPIIYSQKNQAVTIQLWIFYYALKMHFRKKKSTLKYPLHVNFMTAEIAIYFDHYCISGPRILVAGL